MKNLSNRLNFDLNRRFNTNGFICDFDHRSCHQRKSRANFIIDLRCCSHRVICNSSSDKLVAGMHKGSSLDVKPSVIVGMWHLLKVNRY